MPGGMRGGQVRRGPGSGPSRGRAVRRRVRRTTASTETAPRRCPSTRRGARPVLVERSARAGATWPTDRARAPNPLPSRDVQRRGSARSEGCARRTLPRGSRRRREGWSGSGRQWRRATPRSSTSMASISAREPAVSVQVATQADERVDRHRPAEADIRATAAASTGRCSSSSGPVPDTSTTAVAVPVLRTPQRRPAPPDRSASPAPRIAHDPQGADKPGHRALSWSCSRCWATLRSATNPRRCRTAARSASTETAGRSVDRRPWRAMYVNAAQSRSSVLNLPEPSCVRADFVSEGANSRTEPGWRRSNSVTHGRCRLPVASIAITGSIWPCLFSASSSWAMPSRETDNDIGSASMPDAITDPHPIERLAWIHRDDHRRRIKRNLQHRHE